MLYNGFVYLAQMDTGHYKIGFSKNPYKRIKHFDTIMPVTVELLHYFPCDNPRKAERILHGFVESFRVAGEWFDLPAYFLNFICNIIYFTDGEFVRKTREHGMNSCCQLALKEAVRTKYVIDVDDDVYEIHAKCIRRPKGWHGPNDLGDNEPLGKWHSEEFIKGRMTNEQLSTDTHENMEG